MGFKANLGNNVIGYVGIKFLNRLNKDVVQEYDGEGEPLRNDRVGAVAVIQTLTAKGGNRLQSNREIHFMFVKADVTCLDDVFAAAYPFFKKDYDVVEDNV